MQFFSTSYHYKTLKFKRIFSVVTASGIVGAVSALIADTLKVITEHYEHGFLGQIGARPYLVFFLPLAGFSMIYLLRYYLFRNKPNRGIKEVLDTINKKQKSLPAYKIPSHYFNGFLTVVFGGSTGIEVSTVVSAAALGALSSKKVSYLKRYRTDLVCAGLAAGVTALFNAPLAGFLFAFEVFTKRKSKLHTVSVATAVLASYVLTSAFFFTPLFRVDIDEWHVHALPYVIIMSVLAAFLAVFLTKSVLFSKKLFASIPNDFVKILAGSLVISLITFSFPALYGEGYGSIDRLFETSDVGNISLLLPLLAVLLLKPIATSVTLGAGGDGGVFAPSLFIGGLLGFVAAVALNRFFDLQLIPVNFMLVGMAAVLSGAIHAPLTAIFLVCALAGNYVLMIPIGFASVTAWATARFLLPYNVYTYKA
jgi:chloride channel protein, CIC family